MIYVSRRWVAFLCWFCLRFVEAMSSAWHCSSRQPIELRGFLRVRPYAFYYCKKQVGKRTVKDKQIAWQFHLQISWHLSWLLQGCKCECACFMRDRYCPNCGHVRFMCLGPLSKFLPQGKHGRVVLKLERWRGEQPPFSGFIPHPAHFIPLAAICQVNLSEILDV